MRKTVRWILIAAFFMGCAQQSAEPDLDRCQAVIDNVAITGMRIGEAVALNRDDVVHRQGLVVIRRSKFGKSRINPLHDTTVGVLRDYANARDQYRPTPRSDAFFVSLAGTRLLYNNVHRTFVKLLPLAELADRKPRRPRIHDLRHSFAVGTLLHWYRQGANVQARLPMLSTWLGHTCPSDTYWYLSATPELMGCATRRLERHWGDDV